MLSIIASESDCGKGVGKALIRSALEDFTARGVSSVRVAVGADNTAANELYRGLGFHQAATRQHHGLTMNIYVIDPAESKATGDLQGP